MPLKHYTPCVKQLFLKGSGKESLVRDRRNLCAEKQCDPCRKSANNKPDYADEHQQITLSQMRLYLYYIVPWNTSWDQSTRLTIRNAHRQNCHYWQSFGGQKRPRENSCKWEAKYESYRENPPLPHSPITAQKGVSSNWINEVPLKLRPRPRVPSKAWIETMNYSTAD